MHGSSALRINVEMLVGLIHAGLATATAERVVAGGKSIEVARVRITERRGAFVHNPDAS
jgi:hypothetical protein